MRRFKFLAGFLVLLALQGPAAAFPEKVVQVLDPWVRVAKKGQNSAVYFVLENSGDTPIRILRAECAACQEVELHESFEENGIAKMRPLTEGLFCAPGQRIELRPGGLHIMLMNLQENLESANPDEGPRLLPIALILEGGGSLNFEAEIRHTPFPARYSDNAPF